MPNTLHVLFNLLLIATVQGMDYSELLDEEMGSETFNVLLQDAQLETNRAKYLNLSKPISKYQVKVDHRFP